MVYSFGMDSYYILGWIPVKRTLGNHDYLHEEIQVLNV